MTLSYPDFSKIDIRIGIVSKVEPFTRAIKPAYKIWVDFGPEVGTLQTSAQVTVNYTLESLLGRQVLGVVNLGTKNIAGFESQFLLLGCKDAQGTVRLASFDSAIPNGNKLH